MSEQEKQGLDEQQADEQQVDAKRRQLLKLSAGTVAGVGVVAGAGAWVKGRMEGIEHDGFPNEIGADFKPMDQRNVNQTYALSKKLQAQHPERDLNFGVESLGPIQPGEKPMHMGEAFHRFLTGAERYDNDKIGYTQLDYALEEACWHGSMSLAPLVQAGVPGQGILTWDQSDVHEHKYPFKDSVEKVSAIKTAAKTIGAARVGICRHDPRWDYNPLYNVLTEQTLTWEEDFPFKPKSVIVMIVPMDYEAIACAPMIPQSATAAQGYSNIAMLAGQMAKFIRGLGFQAVGATNDLGNSVAYAISAGLGEGSRNGAMVAPNLGPRIRICKVYTDLELDEVAYDKPRTFGIQEFCENCKRCGDACPSGAICMDDKPSMGPTYPGGDDPEYTWDVNKGVRKFYSDPKKCLKFWADNGGDCGACIAACPWNKPDFWHHRLIDASNTFTGGTVHGLMTKADILFGYGNVNDEEAVIKFWKSGFSGDFV
ncbi:reductive dehalogenase [Ferrimonas sediminum]|uniref:Reductive dehalogenase n=1 Tax=Ferrimonas sediminum TaxID=718193 RepID=A0A1G9BUH2_9GAMM|nr:reductive dehalogenase [Ferrimonas sediminum]SDK42635.1 reductive dehalogenase [Ferrimonas sediminum]